MPPSLLTAHSCAGHIHLILGSGPLAASRACKSIDLGAFPIILSSPDHEVHYTLSQRIASKQAKHLPRSFIDSDLTSLGRPAVSNVVDAVFVTASPGSHATSPLAKHIFGLCHQLRIPVNVTDAPELCSFTLLATHTDGPLQIGVSTSGRGCKLASRIRREIVSALPSNFGAAVERLGTIRRRIWAEDHAVEGAMLNVKAETDLDKRSETRSAEVEDDESANQKATFNALIAPSSSTHPEIARTRRLRWLAQICEYWPLQRLSQISDSDIDAILAAYTLPSPSSLLDSPPPLHPNTLDARPMPQTLNRGIITLVGAGPGHPALLTVAALTALKTSTYILADKLIPPAILALIPRRTKVHIARKFPGNAAAAQVELQDLALAALERGESVCRLKQGDPYVYGRGGEEVRYFQERGWRVRVVPGLTSAVVGPECGGVPVTERGVAEEVVVCTGVGKGGKGWEGVGWKSRGGGGRTVVVLMGLCRLEGVVRGFTGDLGGGKAGEEGTTDGHAVENSHREGGNWPPSTPCAVIERASCPDQRVIRSTLEWIVRAVDEEGSRPPGLLVVGAVCEALYTPKRGCQWVVEEGFAELEGLDGMVGLTGVDSVGDEGLGLMKGMGAGKVGG